MTYRFSQSKLRQQIPFQFTYNTRQIERDMQDILGCSKKAAMVALALGLHGREASYSRKRDRYSMPRGYRSGVFT